MQIHEVVYGDTLTGIAKQYGFEDWRTIYNHSCNTAFRTKRPDPNKIYPGDKVVIPNAETSDTPPNPDGTGGPENRDRRRWSRKCPSMDTTLGVQFRLSHAGFDPGPIDGIYGPKTAAGNRRFQQFCKNNSGKGDPTITDAGPVDGIAGPLTRTALKKYYEV